MTDTSTKKSGPAAAATANGPHITTQKGSNMSNTQGISRHCDAPEVTPGEPFEAPTGSVMPCVGLFEGPVKVFRGAAADRDQIWIGTTQLGWDREPEWEKKAKVGDRIEWDEEVAGGPSWKVYLGVYRASLRGRWTAEDPNSGTVVFTPAEAPAALTEAGIGSRKTAVEKEALAEFMSAIDAARPSWADPSMDDLLSDDRDMVEREISFASDYLYQSATLNTQTGAVTLVGLPVVNDPDGVSRNVDQARAYGHWMLNAAGALEAALAAEA